MFFSRDDMNTEHEEGSNYQYLCNRRYRQQKGKTILTSQSVQECQPSENFQQTIVICQNNENLPQL
jgi:hypothetical protein